MVYSHLFPAGQGFLVSAKLKEHIQGRENTGSSIMDSKFKCSREPAASGTVLRHGKRHSTDGFFVQSPLAGMCAAPDQPYRPVHNKQVGDLSLLSILVCRRNFGISFLRPFLLQGMPRPVRCLVVQCLSRQCLRPVSHRHTVWLFCSIRQEGLKPQDTREACKRRYCRGPPSWQWACSYCE